MCGLAGFVGNGSRDGLEKMAVSIRHRGPDDQGIFCEGGIGLAHSRLSIIDLSSAGHQPMFSGDKSVAMVYNGEIYNFPELRENLLSKGYKFRGNSDTEVIIYLYQQFGEGCFEKMNGMFALAIYDFSKEKLILARDRMGEKPLYWAVQNNTFVFASELGALLSSGLVKKEIDLVSLNKYLLFDYVPTPDTMLKDVFKLEPGTYLVYEKGSVRKQKFWRPKEGLSRMGEKESLVKLDSLLNESVASELISDVPLGVFLSGGIDSSTVAWYAQKNSKEPINTFSIGFKDPDFDESGYAKEVATLLGTWHHERIVSPENALSVIPQIPNILSEPVADASIIPTFLLAQFTREKVKVSLGGNGGDEVFAGYSTFHAERFFDWYRRVPPVARMLGKGLIDALPVSDTNFGWSYNLKKFSSSDINDDIHRHEEWLGSFSGAERKKLSGERLRETTRLGNVFENIDAYADEYRQPDSHNRLLYAYLRSYLLDEVLVKVDRASMYHALEVRAPILDYRVVDFVFSLPYSLKYKNFETKYLLKKLMKNRLPNHIIHRKKKGFGVPMARWLKNELKDFCNDLLSSEEIRRQGLFNPEYVSRLKTDHFEGRKDNRKELWNLMVFSLWYEKWLS